MYTNSERGDSTDILELEKDQHGLGEYVEEVMEWDQVREVSYIENGLDKELEWIQENET